MRKVRPNGWYLDENWTNLLLSRYLRSFSTKLIVIVLRIQCGMAHRFEQYTHFQPKSLRLVFAIGFKLHLLLLLESIESLQPHTLKLMRSKPSNLLVNANTSSYPFRHWSDVQTCLRVLLLLHRSGQLYGLCCPPYGAAHSLESWATPAQSNFQWSEAQGTRGCLILYLFLRWSVLSYSHRFTFWCFACGPIPVWFLSIP